MDASISKERAAEASRGRHAESPKDVPLKGWKDILWRTWSEINDDRVTLIAAGVTYYLLLSLFPTLTAFVSLYGLFTDPATVAEHLRMLSSVVPAGGMQILDEQLTRLTAQGNAALGWGLLISLSLALWSASSGVKSLFEAMNIAYDEREERNFFVLNGLALLFTLLGLIAGIVMVSVVVLMPAVLGFLGLGENVEWIAQGVGYLLLAVLLFVGIAALYRFGPSRQQARWRWLTPGAIFAILVILAASGLFSWYAANFANYEKTYGSLGALIGFLFWMWLCITGLIVGAELNSETEHQTAENSTIGENAPLGMRHATMADTVGKSVDEGKAETKDDEKSEDWHSGYRAAREQYRPRGRRSAGGFAFAVPAALVLGMMDRNRNKRS